VSGAAIAHINLHALAHNLALVRSIAPRSRILSIIKGNAYGHGLVPVARALADADGFGVARLAEAVALRNAGIVKPIIMLEGFSDAWELERARELGLSVVVHSDYQIRILEKSDLPGTHQKLAVWLKLNTGMNRLGFVEQDLEATRQRLNQCESVEIEAVMSHFSCADQTTNPTTLNQINCFDRLTCDWQASRSLANSGGLLAWPQSHFDWVRPGIMLYGISPFEPPLPANIPQLKETLAELKPVMTLKSRLIAVNKVAAGSAVGYGGTWTCDRDSAVGVVAIGYGDGYSRQAEAGTPVLIGGERFPVIGTVSMDMLTVDLTDASSIQPGQEVTLWGEGLQAAEVAEHMHTIPYELTTGLTDRVVYHYE
jgi:alanine racemase